MTIFRAMIRTAHQRGFHPRLRALPDGWYSSLDNLKLLRGFGWMWLTRLKANRLVNKDRQGPRPLSRTGNKLLGGPRSWLTGYGLVKVFKIVAPDGDIGYWATSDLADDRADARQQYAEFSWTIENYPHRGIKRVHGGGAACQARSAVAQRNHIGLALRAL